MSDPTTHPEPGAEPRIERRLPWAVFRGGVAQRAAPTEAFVCGLRTIDYAIACKLAIEAGLILKSPCLPRWRPSSRRKPINPPSAEEAAKILQHSQSHPLRQGACDVVDA